jgi:hypothetical protein
MGEEGHIYTHPTYCFAKGQEMQGLNILLGI